MVINRYSRDKSEKKNKMTDMLLFGCLVVARRARPQRFRLLNAHVDEYVSEKDVKVRFRFARDSIN